MMLATMLTKEFQIYYTKDGRCGVARQQERQAGSPQRSFMDVVKEDMPGGWCDASVRWRQMIPCGGQLGGKKKTKTEYCQ